MELPDPNASAAPDAPPPARRRGRRTPRWMQALLHLHDSPHRTALAFALGVLVSFSPFLGLQMLLAFSAAFALGLNRLAVFIGLNVNLPWFMPPWYAGTTLGAARLMGVGLPPDFRRQLDHVLAQDWTSAAFWHEALTMLRPLLAPYLVGPTVAAVPLAVLAYVAARAVLERRRRAPAPAVP